MLQEQKLRIKKQNKKKKKNKEHKCEGEEQ